MTLTCLKVVAAGCALLAAGTGCLTQPARTPAAGLAVEIDASRENAGGTPPHGLSGQLRPGLVINVAVFVAGKKEIEQNGKRVSDGGTLALPLLGIIECRAETLDALSDRLTAAYREYFVNPQVIVEFVRDDNKEGLSPWGYVTVLGRVKKPGRIALPATRDLTLSGAVQQAGGFDSSAKDTAIRVTRRYRDGSVKTMEVNLKAVGSEGLFGRDIVLQAEDVVFVPELVF